MSGIKQIFNKEMARIFKDKKMVFSVFLLPVLIMVVILSIVNGLASNMKDDIESHVAQVYIVNEPEALNDILDASKAKFKLKSIDGAKEMKQAKKEILDGEADLIVEFPDNFRQEVEDYQEGDKIPQVKTYQNPSEDYSRTAADNMDAALEAYRQFLLSQRVSDMEQLTVFQINSDNDEMYIQDEKKASGKAIGMMLPYFITILLFAGAMGIGTDMIAGEKERGTMASLLVSPVKRSSIVLGKVFSLMTVSGISSLIYVIAMVICAPIMMGYMGGPDKMSISLSPQQGIMLGAMLVALSFLYSSIIALISVFAKSTKEASTYVMPAYMLVLIVGLVTMFTSGEPSQTTYFIPFYNNALVLQGILSQEVTLFQYGVTLAETLAIGAILLGVIVKAFESEKVMSA
ncbi:ABC transporter permease [[Clostridium] scindens]|uniref:ABC transporter permease n=1 Tax=Clostridium scindens (strain JCM 10418 / VPI 12708) TaxID=29347 RepID=UPI001D068D89|nr:ABC transporter permease [[Clostridium] scindens]MCB6285568.1 ABC transporter permease [[Clostridium] scindens]MCB6420355.1 ABC transporter permease [[Clostridium] scindens]MCB7192180.1 ABC transporter permease [[Clostridium] scindens]MCB7285363.1 ABC transporter permease [[Clostridium] scindens]MCG4929080.1 ABC transporter permease [[Clostridium] scindens]